MFCKSCRKEIDGGVRFCPECGAAQEKVESVAMESGCEFGAQNSEGKFNDVNSAGTGRENAAPKQDETMKAVVDGIGKTNSLCIASLVLVILMFFFNYYGVVSYAALIFAILGFRAIKKSGEKGLMLSVVCMAVSGVVSLVTIMEIVEYNRYMAASYGELDGFLQWLGDFL